MKNLGALSGLIYPLFFTAEAHTIVTIMQSFIHKWIQNNKTQIHFNGKRAWNKGFLRKIKPRR